MFYLLMVVWLKTVLLFPAKVVAVLLVEASHRIEQCDPEVCLRHKIQNVRVYVTQDCGYP